MEYICKQSLRTIGWFLSMSIMLLLSSCQESNGPNLAADKGDAAPGQVKNISVKKIRGGAILHYSLPQEKSLSYIKAVYSTKSNGEKEAKASRQKDSLVVEGFANATPHKVKLYSVSRGGNASEPVTKTVTPGKPSYITVSNSINVEPAFGGIRVKYHNNKNNSKLAIIFVQDTLDEVLDVNVNNITAQKNTYNLVNLSTNNYKLGYYVRDRFNNRSDTTYQNISPLFEKEINGTNFTYASFAFDSVRYHDVGKLFDHAVTPGHNRITEHSWLSGRMESHLPSSVSINLGKKVKISRIKLFGVPGWAQYREDYPKKFELWGSPNPDLNAKVPDNSWVKLGSFDTSTGDFDHDLNTPYPQNGVNYPIPDASSHPYIKYLRFKMLSNYAGTPVMRIGELKIFGSEKK